MSEWGWNPATIASFGAIAGTAAALAAYWAASIVAKESKLRTRPLVGLSAIVMLRVDWPRPKPSGTPETRAESLGVRLENSGSLPANIREVVITITPVPGHGRVINDIPVTRSAEHKTALLPGKVVDIPFGLGERGSLRDWSDLEITVSFQGKIKYDFGKDMFESEFEGQCDFSEGQRRPPEFRNISLT